MANSNLRLPEQNNVILVGRLTRDPDSGSTTKGQAICRFDIAVNRRYKDNTGNWQDDVSYIPIVVWGDSAKRCGERLKKGTPVHIEGRLKSRSWETKEGQKRTTLEVIARRVQFLSKAETGGAEVESQEAEEGAPAPAAAGGSDEEIPF
ncbi:MAG: single-stranded DNA-binding protein [Elusimicrobiota bacterium]